jgi:hypothetical protein
MTLVTTNTMAKRLNSLRVTPGARNPFVSCKPPHYERPAGVKPPPRR